MLFPFYYYSIYYHLYSKQTDCSSEWWRRKRITKLLGDPSFKRLLVKNFLLDDFALDQTILKVHRTGHTYGCTQVLPLYPRQILALPILLCSSPYLDSSACA
jgi:hypothetical protein